MKQISKNKKAILLILGLFIIISFLFTSGVKGAEKLEINWPTAPGGKGLTPTSSLVDFVEYSYRWGILLGGLAAFFALVIAGFKYLTSVGDPTKMREARDRIMAAIIGLVLLLSTYLILNTLNPELTILTAPTTTVPGLGGGLWQPPEWDKPCEWVIVYKEKSYEDEFVLFNKSGPYCIPALGACTPSGGIWPLESCIEIGTDGIPWVGWGAGQTAIGSIKMKGACQMNLYETAQKCEGNFTAIGKSMPNLEWVALEHIRALFVTDISAPIKPKVTTLVHSNLQKTPGEDTWEVKLKGDITDMGRADEVLGFFEYGTNDLYLHQRAPLSPEHDIPKYNIGSFEYAVEELATCTTYYWKALARNIAGTDNSAATATFNTLNSPLANPCP